jgi:hypothetical protein
MTLESLQDGLKTLNEVLLDIYRETDFVGDGVYTSPEIISVSNGSFIVDFVVPVACALLPELISLLRSKLEKKNNGIKYSFAQKRIRWTKKDNLEVCLAVLKEYAVKKKSTDVKQIIARLSASKKFGPDSVKMKIQNIKHLMDKAGISNTLNISALSKCSSDNRTAFEEACRKLNI